jgi:hypothetical protein
MISGFQNILLSQIPTRAATARLNKRVRCFAGALRASLSRAGCAACEDDLRAECAALVDRLQRFVAEGGGGGGEDTSYY